MKSTCLPTGDGSRTTPTKQERWEVFVATFPGFSAKRQISPDGGVQPQWSGDGRELFYLTGDGSMMAVRVAPGPEFAVSPPSRLFAARIQPPMSHSMR
jgi:hypothetical protein